jgi:hypothetical protein
MKVLRVYPDGRPRSFGLDRVTKQMPRLESLAAPSAALSVDELVAVARQCPLLTSLTLSSCTISRPAAAGAGNDVAEAVNLREFPIHCPRLQQLRLTECDRAVDDALLLAVARGCPDLRVLNVDMCTQVTDAGVNAIATACHNLEFLAIAGCVMTTNAAITQLLAHCPFLQELQVNAESGAGAGYDVEAAYDSHPWLSFRRLTF